MDLGGRVALVTGAGRRLGRAMAGALAARGMVLAIHHHASGEGAAELREEIVAGGGRAACFPADLTDADAARELPERVAAEFGRLDVLVNSAAVMHRLRFEDTTPEQYDAIMDLNLRAAFFCAQGAARALRVAKGKIVNLSDLAGLEPWPGYAAHSVSKAGVAMLTKVQALALAPDVTVNAIAPGAVLVPDDYDRAERERLARDTPLRRLGRPEDVVAALLYLLEGGDFLTGEVLVVDGGRILR
ncbi:MAG: SDR family oxidoreductase [Gemmatimonadales bacterium]|nr:SDR family oxidoreductase [Gemmatimonadales bacterium]MBA3554466.1 SDR family oxidoreductase [Gemmatimonadales bacterium]